MKFKVKPHENYFHLVSLSDENLYNEIINEDTPCDGCVHVQKCGEKQLACFAFAMYVNNGTVNWSIPRMPTKRTYARIMRREVSPSLTREVNHFAKEHSK